MRLPAADLHARHLGYFVRLGRFDGSGKDWIVQGRLTRVIHYSRSGTAAVDLELEMWDPLPVLAFTVTGDEQVSIIEASDDNHSGRESNDTADRSLPRRRNSELAENHARRTDLDPGTESAMLFVRDVFDVLSSTASAEQKQVQLSASIRAHALDITHEAQIRLDSNRSSESGQDELQRVFAELERQAADARAAEFTADTIPPLFGAIFRISLATIFGGVAGPAAASLVGESLAREAIKSAATAFVAQTGIEIGTVVADRAAVPPASALRDEPEDFASTESGTKATRSMSTKDARHSREPVPAVPPMALQQTTREKPWRTGAEARGTEWVADMSNEEVAVPKLQISGANVESRIDEHLAPELRIDGSDLR